MTTKNYKTVKPGQYPFSVNGKTFNTLKEARKHGRGYVVDIYAYKEGRDKDGFLIQDYKPIKGY